MFYPEDGTKANWDLFITIILIYTCIITPARLAFDNDGDIEIGWETARWIVDFCFLVDIVINFNTAHQDDDFKICDDRKWIAVNYISGWFVLDVFAILPISEFAQFGKPDNAEESE